MADMSEFYDNRIVNDLCLPKFIPARFMVLMRTPWKSKLAHRSFSEVGSTPTAAKASSFAKVYPARHDQGR
ncbi:MAG: hypothetical protein L6437_00390 [Kiritimatiellae bacterium]|nr:hypothetical protein [Verrucomicrobiota bacterium]MCG2658688.1 hypothetical protein [Kiritimatiellia bacterium]